MKNIGIICEGPTDYIILKNVINLITGDTNYFVLLQPEPDLRGQYGNGWKGVWKWCHDYASIRMQLMDKIQPALDFLVIQMDGDVSRKEKVSHCGCGSVKCPSKISGILWSVTLNQNTGITALSFFPALSTTHPFPVIWNT